MNKLKQSLNVMKFHVKELEMREDSFGVCEKLHLFPELRAEDCHPQRQRVTPSVKKIRNQPVVITRINTDKTYSLTTISHREEDCFVAGHSDRVSVYNKDTRKLHDFSRPPGIRKWSPLRVNAYNGGEQPVVIVTNRCSRADRGGVYVYTADGRFTGKTIRVHNPRDAAALDDRRVAVLLHDGRTCRGWVDVYDIETGDVVISTRNTTNQRYDITGYWTGYFSVSPVTQEIIVTHDGGVTALSPADLTPRWVYHCREDGAGQLHQPLVVCVDQAGRVMVDDRGTSRVVVFSEVGEYVTALSTGGFMKIGPFGLTVTRHGQLVMSGLGHDDRRSIFIAEYLEK